MKVSVHKRKNVPWQVKDQVSDKTNCRCWYCGLELEWGSKGQTRPHVDHQVPVYDGGTNDIDNLVLCCQKCNYQKGVKPLEKFRRRDTIRIVEWLDTIIDGLEYLEWWHDNEREKEAIRRLADIRDLYRTLRITYFGEAVSREWSNYSI